MKAMVPVLIVKILQERSSVQNPIKQVEIIKLLETEYKETIKRNALGRYVRELRTLYPYNIVFKTKKKRTADGETSEMIESIWWENDTGFEASEVRLMADAVMASSAFKENQKKDLIGRLASLNENAGLKSLLNVTETVSLTPLPTQENPDFMLNIEVLDEAITHQYQVTFDWGEYDMQGRFGPAEDGKPTTVEPRQLAFNNGHYYVIATYPGKTKLYHFRVDLLLNVSIKEDGQHKPVKAGNRDRKPEESLSKYLSEHLMMFGDSTPTARILVKRKDSHPARLRVFETFGQTAAFITCDSDGIIYEVKGNLDALRHWIKQNSDSIMALSPEKLRRSLAADAAEMLRDYE